MNRLLLILGALVILAVPVSLAVRAQSRLPVSVLAAQLETSVPHSSWLARCTALPISAVDGIEVLKATIYAQRVTAVLRKAGKIGFLQCHRLGVYSGAPVYTCFGPTVIRDRMAADTLACPQVLAWSAVPGLAPAIRTWVAERSTCCGVATVGGEVRSEWPCRWELEPGRVTVTSRSGYGPGVVGAEQPCAHVAP